MIRVIREIRASNKGPEIPTIFVYSRVQSTVISVTSTVNKNNPNNQNICEKVKFDKDFIWGRLFHDINLKNNGAIVILQFSTICG